MGIKTRKETSQLWGFVVVIVVLFSGFVWFGFAFHLKASEGRMGG